MEETTADDVVDVVVEMMVTEIVIRLDEALGVGVAAATVATPTKEYAFQP